MEVLPTVPILRIFEVAKPGATVFLRVTGLQDFHALTDPFGNRLRFNEDLK